MILWLRGVIFTLLPPRSNLAAGFRCHWRGLRLRRGWFALGWLPVIARAFIYGVCPFRFLISGGTPAIFFTRHLRFLLGEEPGQLVRGGGLYRWSRNPMYVGVTIAVFGQTILFGSRGIAIYGMVLWAMFHLVVVVLEERICGVFRSRDMKNIAALRDGGFR